MKTLSMYTSKLSKHRIKEIIQIEPRFMEYSILELQRVLPIPFEEILKGSRKSDILTYRQMCIALEYAQSDNMKASAEKLGKERSNGVNAIARIHEAMTGYNEVKKELITTAFDQLSKTRSI